MTPSQLLEAIDRVTVELEHISSQPHKTSLYPADRQFCNILPAHTTDGLSGCKVIAWNEDTGVTEAIVTLARGGVVRSFPAVEVTALRCGVLAAIAVRRVFDFGASIRLGIIGPGRLSSAVEQVLSQVFNVQQVIHVHSPRRSQPQSFADVERCDVVISATSAHPSDPRLEFSPNQTTSVYVAFDGGFILGESFRRIAESSSDYPDQLKQHWNEEFPDFEPGSTYVTKVVPLTEPPSGQRPCVSYVYGVGVADLVMADILFAGWDQ